MTRESTIPGLNGFKPPSSYRLSHSSKIPILFLPSSSKSNVRSHRFRVEDSIGRFISRRRRRKIGEKKSLREILGAVIVRQGGWLGAHWREAWYIPVYIADATSLVLPFVITGGHILFIIIG